MHLSRALGTVVAALIVASLAGFVQPAQAQKFHLMTEVGVLSWNQNWDYQGTAVDHNLGNSETNITWNVGMGLTLPGIGSLKLKLTTVNVDTGDQARFGVRELQLAVSRALIADRVQNLKLELGFKLDIAPLKDKAPAGAKLDLSNDNNAIIANIFYSRLLSPKFSIRIGTDFVYNLEDEARTTPGVLFNPTFGVRFNITKQGTLGLDLGVVVQLAQSPVNSTLDDRSGYAFWLMPSFAWRLTKDQRIKLSVGGHLEDVTVGIPVVGENFPAFLAGANLQYLLSF